MRAVLLALVLGMITALLSQLPWRLPRGLTQAYVEIFRNTPLLIQIFIVYFGLPQLGLKLSAFLSGLSALVLYTAAYNTEIFRAGLEAVPKGQREAARSTGLTPLQVLRSATVGGARAMGMEGEIGTIDAGRAADLVILDADPLADVANLARFHRVIRAGRVFDPDQLIRSIGGR